MVWKHSHGAEPDTFDHAALVLYANGAELNMPHNIIVVASNKRKDAASSIAQHIYDICFLGASEGLYVDLANGCEVLALLLSDGSHHLISAQQPRAVADPADSGGAYSPAVLSG